MATEHEDVEDITLTGPPPPVSWRPCVRSLDSETSPLLRKPFDWHWSRLVPAERRWERLGWSYGGELPLSGELYEVEGVLHSEYFRIVAPKPAWKLPLWNFSLPQGFYDERKPQWRTLEPYINSVCEKHNVKVLNVEILARRPLFGHSPPDTTICVIAQEHQEKWADVAGEIRHRMICDPKYSDMSWIKIEILGIAAHYGYWEYNDPRDLRQQPTSTITRDWASIHLPTIMAILPKDPFGGHFTVSLARGRFCIPFVTSSKPHALIFESTPRILISIMATESVRDRLPSRWLDAQDTIEAYLENRGLADVGCQIVLGWLQDDGTPFFTL